MTTVFNELLRVLPSEDLRPAALVASFADELSSVVDYFERRPPPEAITQVVTHRNCDKCRQDRDVPQPDIHIRLPDSLERRVLALASGHFTHLQQLKYCFSFFEIPRGSEIVESAKEPYIQNPQILCSDIIFFHEPFYSFDPGKRIAMFSLSPIRSILNTLLNYGYTLSFTPRVGQVVIYTHGQAAEHYARIESIDRDGRITLISKFGHGHIYRHLIDIVPFNDLIVLLDPPRSRPHPLYTSPSLIRARLLAAQSPKSAPAALGRA